MPHSFASLMIAAGVNAKALSTFMGHASIAITLDRYGHLMPGSGAGGCGATRRISQVRGSRAKKLRPAPPLSPSLPRPQAVAILIALPTVTPTTLVPG